MTSFTVVWHVRAEEKLAAIWLRASDREAISNAANTIERQLHDSPMQCGEFVALNIREWSVAPLMVLFSVSEPDRMVKVLSVGEATQ
jgi:hypothetical protein